MANLCDFVFVVRGQQENCKKFLDALQQQGNVYMGRGACVMDIRDVSDKNDAFVRKEGFAYCKWSIASALTTNALDMRAHPEHWVWQDPDDPSQLVHSNELTDRYKEGFKIVTLQEACREFQVDFEAFSTESGCQFAEHILIRNGEILQDECIDYYEFWADEYDTKEEAEEAYETPITDEEWEIVMRDGYFSRGGFHTRDEMPEFTI